jgi:hypothetical protein
VAPGNSFDSNKPTAATVDSAHGVQKEDGEPPQGDELEAPLGEFIVARRELMAARADRGGSLARPHRDLDTLLIWAEPGVPLTNPWKRWHQFLEL